MFKSLFSFLSEGDHNNIIRSPAKAFKDRLVRGLEDSLARDKVKSDKLTRKSRIGWTSLHELHEAVKTGNLDTVKTLIKENIDVTKLLLEAENIDTKTNRVKILEIAFEKAFYYKDSHILQLLNKYEIWNKNRKSKWSTIEIINIWNKVCRLGAVSKTVSLLHKLNFPCDDLYDDLKGNLLFEG